MRINILELNFLSIKEFVELVSDPEHYLQRNALVKLNKYFKIAPRMKVIKDHTTGEERIEPELVMDKNGKPTAKLTYVREFQAIDSETGQPKWVEQDLDLPEMMQLIARARQDISAMPIMGGLIAGTEAFKYNSVPYSSQHLGHVLMLYYTKMMDELKSKIDILTYGVVGLMLLCGTGVAIYIISMAFKGGTGAA